MSIDNISITVGLHQVEITLHEAEVLIKAIESTVPDPREDFNPGLWNLMMYLRSVVEDVAPPLGESDRYWYKPSKEASSGI